MDEIIERYEYKYLVPDSVVPAIRNAVKTTSKIDRYAGPDGTYRIRSLYFDTDKFD
ncbi:MAG TPA: VTC domain-containing protein, partial [Polyangium sp.]|nr:VTC domain-containing protein [Polyangium sp.]